jgi:hypothetical protein
MARPRREYPDRVSAHATAGKVVHRMPIPLPVCLDGRPVSSTTRFADVGPYVLLFETVLPEHAVEVQSVYVGHPGASTQATHLLLGPAGWQPTSETVEHSEVALPPFHARHRRLYDHAQRLQERLEEVGYQAQVDLDDVAITKLDALPPATDVPAA